MPDPISPAISEPLTSLENTELPVADILNAIRISRGGYETNPSDSYTTRLSPEEETAFQDWAKRNNVRMEPGWNEDYDMRGLWKSDTNIVADPRGHWPDTYKKPNHPTFSNESIYATTNAPHWEGFKLIAPDGRVVADETPEIMKTQKDRQLSVEVGGLTPEEEYKYATARIAPLLSEAIERNPAKTNYMIRLMQSRDFPYQNALWGSLSNLPNTLVLNAHGRTNMFEEPLSNALPHNPLGHFGFMPDDDYTNEFGNALRDRRQIAMKPGLIPSATTLGGLGMDEIARGLAGATNDVKRIVLISCYLAGYSFAEMKRYFPNLEQLIAPDPYNPTTKAHTGQMFNRERDPYMATNITFNSDGSGDWRMRSYTPNRTNVIEKTSDWLPNPPADFQYMPGYRSFFPGVD